MEGPHALDVDDLGGGTKRKKDSEGEGEKENEKEAPPQQRHVDLPPEELGREQHEEDNIMRKPRKKKRRRRDRLNDGLDGSYWTSQPADKEEAGCMKSSKRDEEAEEDDAATRARREEQEQQVGEAERADESPVMVVVIGSEQDEESDGVLSRCGGGSPQEGSADEGESKGGEVIPVKDIHGGLDGRYWAVSFLSLLPSSTVHIPMGVGVLSSDRQQEEKGQGRPPMEPLRSRS